MEELDAQPTVEELSEAIDDLAAGKAPGSDGIPLDLIKHCETAFLTPLHEVLCQCRQEGAVPQDMRNAKIITLYKNKGEKVIATTTGASPFSALLARSTQEWSLSACRSLPYQGF